MHVKNNLYYAYKEPTRHELVKIGLNRSHFLLPFFIQFIPVNILYLSC